MDDGKNVYNSGHWPFHATSFNRTHIIIKLGDTVERQVDPTEAKGSSIQNFVQCIDKVLHTVEHVVT
jgi:hypothetical protein